VQESGGWKDRPLEAASPGLDLSWEAGAFGRCAEPLAKATGVKLVVDGPWRTDRRACFPERKQRLATPHHRHWGTMTKAVEERSTVRLNGRTSAPLFMTVGDILKIILAFHLPPWLWATQVGFTGAFCSTCRSGL